MLRGVVPRFASPETEASAAPPPACRCAAPPISFRPERRRA
jgi:hypothetical protein